MAKTISQLWYGNLAPTDQFCVRNPQIKQLEILIQRNLDKFEKTLSGHQQELFSRYSGNMTEHELLSNEQAFCDGFCLGAKIVAEALLGVEPLSGV